MDFREIAVEGDDLLLLGLRHFALEDILDCGQCFRWEPAGPRSFTGVVRGICRTVTQQGDTLWLHGVSSAEFQEIWRDYFDFGRDYGAVKEVLARDPVMARAIAFTPGMRVLRQDPWETLVSFIISANNNIPRIKGIVDRLCRLAGEPLGEDRFAFPAPQKLAALEVEDLSPARLGYRAKYVLDAAGKVASGELDLSPLYTLPIEEARLCLQQVAGVGPKVAQCILLYGLGRGECVPVDVWIRRALEQLYPGGIPEFLQPVAGLGQQYLFHYVRNCPGALAG